MPRQTPSSMTVAPNHWRQADIDTTAIATHGTRGNGTATILPMTQAEMDAIVKRPIGFAPPHPNRRSTDKP